MAFEDPWYQISPPSSKTPTKHDNMTGRPQNTNTQNPLAPSGHETNKTPFTSYLGNNSVAHDNLPSNKNYQDVLRVQDPGDIKITVIQLQQITASPISPTFSPQANLKFI